MRLFFLLIFIYSLSSSAGELKPFYSDYCTFFPEGTPQKPGLWQDCCYEHDLRYWFGGTKVEQYQTDIFLKECVQKKAGSTIARMMYTGVRSGHLSPIKHKTHWGWGWREKRDFYQSLTLEEKKYIKQSLLEIDQDTIKLEDFFKKYSL